MLKLDPTNPLQTAVQTRHGSPARIICVDRKCGDGFAIVALVAEKNSECISFYRPDGKYYDQLETQSSHDLINVPRKHVKWINFYPATSFSYSNREAADLASQTSSAYERIACVKVEFTEGEGL